MAREAPAFYSDFRRYRSQGHSLSAALLAQGLWATVAYRAAKALIDAMPRGPLRLAATAIGAALQKLAEILTGICIPRDCELGPGAYFPRFGGTVLGPSPIGENCTLEHNITLAMSGKGAESGVPVVGNRVFIGAHSILVGNIRIGDDAVIFPGSVVARNVPPRAVVMGHPARIVARTGSFDRIAYDGMEHDPARSASLARASFRG